MKKVISILVLSISLMCGLFISGQMKAAEKDEEKISVEVQTVKGKNDYERDLHDQIQIYYYRLSNFLEITCSGEGNVCVYIIGKTNRDEIQNQMRLKFARKLQKRNVTEKSHTSYSLKWLSNVN